MRIYYNPKLKEVARNLRNNMTIAEKSAWRMLKSKQFMGLDFHRQKPIGNFIADFYCSELSLVIEIDGVSHNDDEVKRKDEMKEQYFKSIGLNILRFTDDQVIGNWMLVENEIKKFISEIQL